jgi:hypothetical protein
MATDTAYAIADAYRGQRRLGYISIAASHCHILTDPAHPNAWDANHADDVTAQTGAARGASRWKGKEHSAPIMIEPRRFRQIGSKSLSFGHVWHAGEQQRPDVSLTDCNPGWQKPATGIP